MTAERLERIAVKSDVSIGQMTEGDREAVLAFAAVRFPPDRDLDEKSVNETLRAFLASGGAMLATDHVELRRWLVDGGWLQRDGFGRVYRLAPTAGERATGRLGDASAERLDARIASHRAAVAAERQRRRDAHLARSPA